VMEDLGLGTKATRPNIIQNLYDRGYVHDDPLIPTEKGMSVAQALTDFASEIASHEMTAELERSMDEISEGRISKDSVVDSSREVLRKVYDHLQSSETEFADIVWEGIREDSVLGPCKKCGKNLVIKKARKSGKRFAGCEGYPECDQTYSLPQRGEIIPLGTLCDACGSPEIKVVGGRGRPWITCVDMDCPKQVERREAAAKAKQQEGGEGSSIQSAQKLERSTT
jgi:DNA topoisomerase-1